MKATTEADLAKYEGQLAGKIVILQAVRPVRMLEDRVVLRLRGDVVRQSERLGGLAPQDRTDVGLEAGLDP